MKREKSAKWALTTLLRQEKEPIGFNTIYAKVQKNSWYITIKSKSTLSKYLKRLQKEGLVIKDIDTRKYCLTDLGAKIATMAELSFILLEASPEIRELGFRTLEAINVETKGLEQCNEKKVIETLGSWIGATTLYSLLEQIKKGKPFVVVALYYLGYIGAAYATMKRHILGKGSELSLHDIIDRMRLEVGLEKYDEYKPTIQRLEKALKKAHSEEVKLLKQLYESEGR